MSSIKIKEVPDGVRNPITEVKTLPPKSKVRQVSFIRQRMFVLTEDDKLYSFRINENAPNPSDPFAATKARFTGDLVLENPVFVKDLPPIK